MEFLVNSIASEEDQSLLGMVITHFNPDDFIGRAAVKLYSIKEMEEIYNNFQPRGFIINELGRLLSDTSVRRTISSALFPCMVEERSKLHRKVLDITDLVLRGVYANGFVVANYSHLNNVLDCVEKGIFIPFKNFKVSNSSFNIYASYQNEDGAFRTFSLLKLEDGSATNFVAAFPATYDLSEFTNIVPIGNVIIGDVDCIFYEVELGLVPFYDSVGEAFLNYLAYSVAFYNIGEKTLKALSPNVINIIPSDKRVYDKAVRKPRVNVSIEHVYKECRLQDIVERLNDQDAVSELIRTNPEANITYQWLVKAYNSPWFSENMEGESEDEALRVSCANLLIDCRTSRLKAALELLTHRYYIYSMGLINDHLNLILKGGGVDGKSVKQSNFGYS